jgi:hypothetical protein
MDLCSLADDLPVQALDSAIVPDLSKILVDLDGKQLSLLWPDGLTANDFYGRCDCNVNTVTVILHTNWETFGGFTPAE